jgi:hypothetical protein
MKNHLHKMLAHAVETGPDALIVTGAAVISAGVGMIYPPAGVIVAGLFTLAAGLMWAGSRK